MRIGKNSLLLKTERRNCIPQFSPEVKRPAEFSKETMVFPFCAAKGKMLFSGGRKRGVDVMHKRSLLFDVQQDGASPQEGEGKPAARGRQHLCALVKIEPVPPWLVLFNQSELKK